MKLSDILKNTSLHAKKDCDISFITNDSREVLPGSLFFALNGSKNNGCNYISEALNKGAAAIISETEIPESVEKALSKKTILLYSKNVLSDLSIISDNFYEHPSGKIKIFGFTGTKGKTTTAYLLENILKLADMHPGVLGTIDYRADGKVLSSSVNTTPFPHTLQKLLSVMRDVGVKATVLEISSHALSLHRVDDISFDVAVFTNLQQDHLDFHKNIENYFLAKAHIFDLLDKSEKKNKAAVINNDDKYADRLKKIIAEKNVKLLTYGINNNSDFFAFDINITSQTSSYKLKLFDKIYDVSINLPGIYNIYNSLAAIAAACAAGISIQKAIEGVSTLQNVPGRLQRVNKGQDFNVFVDYAHTEASLENVLENLKHMPHNKIITVFGCGGDRDRTKRAPMGKVACGLSDNVIVTDDNPRFEDRQQIFTDIEKGIKDIYRNYEIIPDRSKAICKAVSMAGKGDIVLIAGKGHETYQLIQGAVFHFSDAEEAEKYLEEKIKKS